MADSSAGGRLKVQSGAVKQHKPWQFKPGQSGNPHGRPKGSRAKLETKFLDDIERDWAEHGASAIKAAREEDPGAYLRVVASLLPKEVLISRPTDELTDDELAAAIDELRGRVKGLEGASSGVEPPAEPEPLGPLPAVH